LGCVGLAVFSYYVIKGKYDPAIKYLFLTDPNTIRFFRTSKTIVIAENDQDVKNKIQKVYSNVAVFCHAQNRR